MDAEQLEVYQRPSLAIILNRPSNMLSFIAQTDTSPKSLIRLQYLVSTIHIFFC